MQRSSYVGQSWIDHCRSGSLPDTTRHGNDLLRQRCIISRKRQMPSVSFPTYHHNRIEGFSTDDQRKFSQFLDHLDDKTTAVLQCSTEKGSSQTERNELLTHYRKWPIHPASSLTSTYTIQTLRAIYKICLTVSTSKCQSRLSSCLAWLRSAKAISQFCDATDNHSDFVSKTCYFICQSVGKKLFDTSRHTGAFLRMLWSCKKLLIQTLNFTMRWNKPGLYI